MFSLFSELYSFVICMYCIEYEYVEPCINNIFNIKYLHVLRKFKKVSGDYSEQEIQNVRSEE